MSFTTRRIFSYNNCLSITMKSSFKRLLVSGCSFTDQIKHTEKNLPLSWPGYAACRCNIPEVIDLSNTAAGNEYIATSIVNEIENYSDIDLQNTLILIMWSGLDRRELLHYHDSNFVKESKRGIIDKIKFEREQSSTENIKPAIAKAEALRSWKNIILVENYLRAKKANFGFSFYVNVFDPPFIPRLDYSSNAPDVLEKNKVQQLKNCSWLHDHNKSVYEYCLKKDLLSDDLFHPDHNGYLDWTDNILLPSLEKKNFAQRI